MKRDPGFEIQTDTLTKRGKERKRQQEQSPKFQGPWEKDSEKRLATPVTAFIPPDRCYRKLIEIHLHSFLSSLIRLPIHSSTCSSIQSSQREQGITLGDTKSKS